MPRAYNSSYSNEDFDRTTYLNRVTGIFVSGTATNGLYLKYYRNSFINDVTTVIRTIGTINNTPSIMVNSIDDGGGSPPYLVEYYDNDAVNGALSGQLYCYGLSTSNTSNSGIIQYSSTTGFTYPVYINNLTGTGVTSTGINLGWNYTGNISGLTLAGGGSGGWVIYKRSGLVESFSNGGSYILATTGTAVQLLSGGYLGAINPNSTYQFYIVPKNYPTHLYNTPDQLGPNSNITTITTPV